MGIRKFTFAIVLPFLVAAAPATKPSTKPATKPEAERPTQEAIDNLFDAKDYAGVLQQVGKVLPLKGDAAKDYDRYELLMMRGESQLQLKQFKSASESFGAAAKETDDNVKAGTARAMQDLLKQVKGTKVQRRVPKKGEKLLNVDLLDLDHRKDALRIVYEDALAAADPKVKAALKSRSFPEISEALDAFGDVHDLELAVTGGDANHATTRRNLLERARTLIAKEIDHAEKDVLDIRERANTVMGEKSGPVPLGNRGRYEADRRKVLRGLSDKDKTDLQGAISTCNTAMKNTKALAKVPDADPPDTDELTDHAKDVIRTAERVLGAKY